MLTLSIFLQPIVEAMGWSRTGVAGAALLNFLCMGVGAFMWGSLSDRYGTRAVVLSGGVLLGVGMVLASQATTLLPVPAPLRGHRRRGRGELLRAPDLDDHPLVHRESQPRGVPRRGRA